MQTTNLADVIAQHVRDYFWEIAHHPDDPKHIAEVSGAVVVLMGHPDFVDELPGFSLGTRRIYKTAFVTIRNEIAEKFGRESEEVKAVNNTMTALLAEWDQTFPIPDRFADPDHINGRLQGLSMVLARLIVSHPNGPEIQEAVSARVTTLRQRLLFHEPPAPNHSSMEGAVRTLEQLGAFVTDLAEKKKDSPPPASV